MQYEQCPSPNSGPRRATVDMIVLHYTGMESEDGALNWLTNPESEVSSHYFVYSDGRVVQMVAEAERAWHAGLSSWHGETDINSRSIGIEIANPGHQFGYPDFPKVQIAAVIALCRDVIGRHAIPAARVLAHSDVAPGRKIDPGEKFPWADLAAAGVGLWAEADKGLSAWTLGKGDRGAGVVDLRNRFRAFGYGVEPGEEFDGPLEMVVTAFQRHFRPGLVDGIADAETVNLLGKLLARAGIGA